MNNSDEEELDDPLADALAAFDDRLAAGIEKSGDETELAIEPALALGLAHRLTAFLMLVEKAAIPPTRQRVRRRNRLNHEQGVPAADLGNRGDGVPG